MKKVFIPLDKNSLNSQIISPYVLVVPEYFLLVWENTLRCLCSVYSSLRKRACRSFLQSANVKQSHQSNVSHMKITCRETPMSLKKVIAGFHQCEIDNACESLLNYLFTFLLINGPLCCGTFTFITGQYFHYIGRCVLGNEKLWFLFHKIAYWHRFN